MPLAEHLVFLISINTVFATVYQVGEDKKSINVQKGDTIDVVLAENPTTGYIWIMSLANPADKEVLQEIKKSFLKAKSKMVGVPGFIHYEVKAIEKGSAKIQGINTRPWQKDDVITTFEMDVVVK